MDISTGIGIIGGLVVIVLGIMQSGDITHFMDLSSILIVLGGTLSAVIASFPLTTLKHTLSHPKIVMKGNKYKPAETIEQLIEFATEARKNGLLALEEKADELEDPFFKRSVMLIVDATEESKLRAMLESEVESMAQRHEDEANIYEKASSYAPAFGMIGTLVGLINMLMEMNLDAGASDAIGKNMGVALVTTFYGCILANLVFSPIAKKLRIRNDEEILYRQIIIEGVMGIQAGDNPKTLRERLATFLDEKSQKTILELDGEGGGENEGKPKKNKRGKKGKDEE